MTVIDAILARRSVGPRYLGLPGPGPHDLRLLAAAAAAAPDHGRLGPCRLILIPKDKRNALADVFVKAVRAADPTATDATVKAARERAIAGPVLLAIIAHIQEDHPDIPPREQWISVGAALQNVLLAAEARGFAAKMVSGRRVTSPVMRAAFGLGDNDHLVGFAMLGTADSDARAKPSLRRTTDQVLSEWVPPKD